jgi:hypothetical protein
MQKFEEMGYELLDPVKWYPDQGNDVVARGRNLLFGIDFCQLFCHLFYTTIGLIQKAGGACSLFAQRADGGPRSCRKSGGKCPRRQTTSLYQQPGSFDGVT